MSDDLFELGERIAELAASINIATCEMLTLVADFDRREGWADNFTSCAEWLAWRTGRTLAAARENVRVAHALEELPLTATAMKSGRLSYTKVRTMTRVATPETEATLLEYAQSTSAARLEWLVRGWKTLSRDGELAAEEVRHRSRTFSVAIDADGMYVVRGRLEPEVGAVLMRAIEAASDALYRGEDRGSRGRATGSGAPMRRDWWPSVRWRRGSGGNRGGWGRDGRRYARGWPWCRVRGGGERQPRRALPGGGPRRCRDAGGARRDGTVRARRGAGERGDIAAHGVRRRAGRDVSPGRRSGERGAADAHHPPAHPPRARGTGPRLSLSGMREPLHRGPPRQTLGRWR